MTVISFKFMSLMALTSLVACAHTTNDGMALCDRGSECVYKPENGYRFMPEKAPDRSTLIVVTLSGGGVRATALAYATLKALQLLPNPSNDGHPSDKLLDKVDIISSVSGGSVTAGWYALKGKDGLSGTAQDNALMGFIEHGAQGPIEWRGLNPAALAAYLVTDYQRSDVLAGYFDDKLFQGAKFGAVRTKYQGEPSQPFVIINATDLGHESRFPFTQGRFDLICTNLDRYSLAYGVAASANFPVAFSPIGLQNHSLEPGCDVLHKSAAWTESGPPVWLREYDCFDASGIAASNAPAPRTNGLLELRTSREARQLMQPDAKDTVLHLVDGGLVDNLGVLSTLSLEDDPALSPGLFQRLAPPGVTGTAKEANAINAPGCLPREHPHAARYSKITKVLYIVVNARTRSPTSIDKSVYPPGVVSSINRVIDTSIDSTILDTQNYLTAEMESILGTGASKCPDENQRKQENAKGPAGHQKCFAIVAIDFEAIPDADCRDYFWKLGTAWTLKKEEIDNVMALPKALLARSTELRDFYADVPGALNELNQWPGKYSISAACEKPDAATKAQRNSNSSD